jgi:hypothetical protein
MVANWAQSLIFQPVWSAASADRVAGRSGMFLHRELSGGGDGGRGIPALRLQDDGGLDSAGARLLGDR